MIIEITSDDERDATLSYKLLLYGLSYESMNDIYESVYEHIKIRKRITLPAKTIKNLMGRSCVPSCGTKAIMCPVCQRLRLSNVLLCTLHEEAIPMMRCSRTCQEKISHLRATCASNVLNEALGKVRCYHGRSRGCEKNIGVRTYMEIATQLVRSEYISQFYPLRNTEWIAFNTYCYENGIHCAEVSWNTKVAMTKAGLTDIAASIREDHTQEESLLIRGFEGMSYPDSVERSVLGMSRSFIVQIQELGGDVNFDSNQSGEVGTVGDREMRHTEWYKRLNEDPEFSQLNKATIQAANTHGGTVDLTNESEESSTVSSRSNIQVSEETNGMELETNSDTLLSEIQMTTEEEIGRDGPRMSDGEDNELSDLRRKCDSPEIPSPRRSRWNIDVCFICNCQRKLAAKMLDYQMKPVNGNEFFKKKKNRKPSRRSGY